MRAVGTSSSATVRPLSSLVISTAVEGASRNSSVTACMKYAEAKVAGMSAITWPLRYQVHAVLRQYWVHAPSWSCGNLNDTCNPE